MGPDNLFNARVGCPDEDQRAGATTSQTRSASETCADSEATQPKATPPTRAPPTTAYNTDPDRFIPARSEPTRPEPTPPTRSFSTPHGTKDVDRNGNLRKFHGTDGKEAKFDSKGEINEIRDPNRNMVIQRGLRGGDTNIVTERNGRRLVSTGPEGGYSERPYLNHNGRTYYQRTYWDHGHAYARVYRDQFYRGMHYYRYVPAYYYHPAFYGWANNPWGAPVYYNWGWGPAPWFYEGYFAPAPYYPSASLWLTDYLLAEDLKQAYEAKQEAQARAEADRAGDQPAEGGAPAQAQLSPNQIKQMVDAEVQRQLAEERAVAQSPQRAATPAISTYHRRRSIPNSGFSWCPVISVWLRRRVRNVVSRLGTSLPASMTNPPATRCASA